MLGGSTHCALSAQHSTNLRQPNSTIRCWDDAKTQAAVAPELSAKRQLAPSTPPSTQSTHPASKSLTCGTRICQAQLLRPILLHMRGSRRRLRCSLLRDHTVITGIQRHRCLPCGSASEGRRRHGMTGNAAAIICKSHLVSHNQHGSAATITDGQHSFIGNLHKHKQSACGHCYHTLVPSSPGISPGRCGSSMNHLPVPPACASTHGSRRSRLNGSTA